MARPERNDADYFPFFAKRGKTLNILQAKYGLEGIGFFTNLLRFLTLTPYHHYQIKLPLDQMNLFAEIGITDETRGVEILDLLATTGKIDYDLWHNHRVIVSESFLASLEDAYAKRNNKIITMDEIRVKYTGNPQATALPVPETHKQEDYGVLKGVDNPQRKGKETKGKDIKEKEEPFFSDSPVPDFEDDIEDAFNDTPEPPKRSLPEQSLNLANLLFTLHRDNFDASYKVNPANIEKWASDIEKLNRIDKRTWEEIETIIRWVKYPGQFWAPNIMSGSKLREKFPTLLVQSKQGKTQNGKPLKVSERTAFLDMED